MASEVYVLGVDPGFASFGWCIVQLLPQWEEVVKVDVVRTEKSSKKKNVKASDDDFHRSQEIAKVLHEVVQKWKPRAVAAEAMSFTRNASSAAKVARVWGVLADVCLVHSLPMTQASPQEIKKVLCGDKAATKEQVQQALETRYVQNFLRFTQEVPRGQWEHGFDAAGAVVACLDTDVLRMARRMGES